MLSTCALQLAVSAAAGTAKDEAPPYLPSRIGSRVHGRGSEVWISVKPLFPTLSRRESAHSSGLNVPATLLPTLTCPARKNLPASWCRRPLSRWSQSLATGG